MIRSGSRKSIAACGLAAAALLFATSAEAKRARCFTTDDGYFPCTFVATDRQGSFEISARGKPTYSLIVDQPGFASAFVNIGGRNVSLPGMYVRSSDDGACWNNPETSTRICAW